MASSRHLLWLVLLAACSRGGGGVEPDANDAYDAGVDGPIDDETCTDVTATDSAVVTAPEAGELVLRLQVQASSPTSWAQAGNEALVLEVMAGMRLIGHLIIHQGDMPFPYAMHAGALSAGESLSIRVSALSASNAAKRVRVCGATLVAAAALPEGDGIVHAPIYRWPVQKRFDDVPLVIGWSSAKAAYQAVMTSENGGTPEICGGGATGMQAEIARWGRSLDIEPHYDYGGAAPTWMRCTGRVATTNTALRTEAAHPIVYYGDGHNRLFEDRGGYGDTCGSGSAEKSDGNLAGWNTASSDTSLAGDDGHVIILRPVPVPLDALDYATFTGRREALPDRYAPWLYRISSQELEREGKIDDVKTLAMSRYLYVDIRVADVGGSGDSYCTPAVNGGFVLRAVASTGTVFSSGQMTQSYVSNGNHDWKRVAIELPAGIAATDIAHFEFDAYNNDGIYVTAIGDAFIPVPDGAGAKLDYVRMGVQPLAAYVDDDGSGCTQGVNMDGPGGTAYPCAGGLLTIQK